MNFYIWIWLYIIIYNFFLIGNIFCLDRIWLRISLGARHKRGFFSFVSSTFDDHCTDLFGDAPTKKTLIFTAGRSISQWSRNDGEGSSYRRVWLSKLALYAIEWRGKSWFQEYARWLHEGGCGSSRQRRKWLMSECVTLSYSYGVSVLWGWRVGGTVLSIWSTSLKNHWFNAFHPFQECGSKKFF